MVQELERPRPRLERQAIIPDNEPDRMVGKANFMEKVKAITEQSTEQSYQAGKVSASVDRWAQITSDSIMLTDIRSYKLKFSEPPYQDRPMPELRFSPEEREFVRTEIETLLQKKVIAKSVHQEGEFISNIFLREKRDKNKFRMILNLSHLNKFTETQHYKMETLLSTLALIVPGALLLSMDFQDAYYSVSIFPPHRKYLKFTFEGQLYEFTVLPMGLADAPRCSILRWKLC